MNTLRLMVAMLFLGLPAFSEASVIITEVAWMGSVTSPNHEWIELHNTDGAAASVDGWTLSDGANLLITLSGTIAAGQYAVLERSSDDTVAGSAFLIYTGALVNTGATLTLRRGDGQIEDRVEGGTNWQSIGGDNGTKYTAQYTGSAWQTGAPTPGAPASNTGTTQTPTTPTTPTGTTSDPGTTTASGGGSSSKGELSAKARSATIPLKKSDAPLQIAITSQDVMYVHQPVTFAAAGTGVGKTIAASLQYRWNFGDLTMATGSKVTHRFEYPGTYVVVVQARFGKHDVVTRKEVTVLPVTISLAQTEHREVLVQNNSIYDVDVSGYQVEMAGKVVVFPPLSYLAAKQAILVPLPAGEAVVRLKDPRRRQIASLGEALPPAVATAPVPVLAPELPTVSMEGTNTILAVTAEPLAEEPPLVDLQREELSSITSSTALLAVPSTTTATVSAPQSAATIASGVATSQATRWPYAAAALVVAGMLAVVWWPRPPVVVSQLSR